MERTLSLGAFTELGENEALEIDGGGGLIVGIVVVGLLAVAIYEPIAQAVDKGNRSVAQGNANRSGESCTIPNYSIWNNIVDGRTYTATPNK